jgi:hypothetical protein
MESEPAPQADTPASQSMPSAHIKGYLALETLGRILAYAPCVGMLFTSFWSVGLSLTIVLGSMTWLGSGRQVPSWMLARPEPKQDIEWDDDMAASTAVL